jgi:hypothetical protein
MSELTERAPDLDARLAELDGRLRAIQAELQRARGPAPTAEVTVCAGPFASLDAVRAFERALAELPGVREVARRGFEGSDRAIIDVVLDESDA